MLLNLLSNAFDAIEESGAVNRRIGISASDESEHVALAVVDHGRGIAADIRDKVFQPFFTTKPIGKGTGLGLSISRGLVEAHHGKLSFTSVPGATRFVVQLPKRQTRRS